MTSLMITSSNTIQSTSTAPIAIVPAHAHVCARRASTRRRRPGSIRQISPTMHAATAQP